MEKLTRYTSFKVLKSEPKANKNAQKDKSLTQYEELIIAMRSSICDEKLRASDEK